MVRFRLAMRRRLGRSFDRGVTLAWRAERWWMRRTGRVHRGVQALVFTPAGELVLLELRYLAGWHLPGGRRRRGEPARAAILRELREELGAFAHGRITRLATLHECSRGVPCEIELFQVDDCVLPARHRLNAEVRSVRAWAVDALPERAEVARARLALIDCG